MSKNRHCFLGMQSFTKIGRRRTVNLGFRYRFTPAHDGQRQTNVLTSHDKKRQTHEEPLTLRVKDTKTVHISLLDT